MNKKYMIDRVTKSGKYFISGDEFGARKAVSGMAVDAGPGLNYHIGNDYGTPEGVKLYAPADGYFLSTCRDGRGNGYGNYILFYIPEADITVHLAHLNHIEWYEGKGTIKEGTFIGTTGNTGLSFGPHLHLGIAKGKRSNTVKGRFGDGTWIDPSKQDYSKLGESKPKPQPKPQSGKQYINIHPDRNNPRYGTYAMGVTPVYKNISAWLEPYNLGGISYEIKGKSQSDVYIVDTRDFGKRQVYLDKSRADITSSPKYKVYGK